MSEVTKKKLSEGRLGDKNWVKRPEVREKIRHSVLRFYAEHPESLELRKPCGKNQYSGSMSSLEKKIAAVLTTKNIPFLHNYKIGRYWADFLIEDRVVIECDGAYWHKDIEKEKRRDNYLHKRGYFVFHLPETKIETDSGDCVRMIRDLYLPFRETVI